jgi:hypothetical protein
MCRTFEEAFQAGWDAPCEHNVPNPVDCPGCRLTPEEAAALALLHRPYLQSATAGAAQSAA